MRYRIKMCAGFLTGILLGGAVDAAALREHPNDRESSRSRRSSSENKFATETARVRTVMLPLLRVTDQRIASDQVQLSIVEDPAINAATAGNGRFFVTTGLLQRANDDQLRGVLAHEIAHEDLGHPAKAQVLGTGLSIGAALLEQLIPGTGALAPIAGTLISNNYTRPLEIQADRHAVTLLERAGYSKRTMIDTLDWLMRRNGDHGGFLSSHPATSERIRALQSLR